MGRFLCLLERLRRPPPLSGEALIKMDLHAPLQIRRIHGILITTSEQKGQFHDYSFQCQPPVRRRHAFQKRRSPVQRRQLLRRDRCQRCRKVHIPEDSLRTAQAHHRRGQYSQEPPHERPQAGPLRLRRIHRSGHHHHGKPAALRHHAAERCPLCQGGFLRGGRDACERA